MWGNAAGLWRLPWQQVTTGYSPVSPRRKTTALNASRKEAESHYFWSGLHTELYCRHQQTPWKRNDIWHRSFGITFSFKLLFVFWILSKHLQFDKLLVCGDWNQMSKVSWRQADGLDVKMKSTCGQRYLRGNSYHYCYLLQLSSFSI